MIWRFIYHEIKLFCRRKCWRISDRDEGPIRRPENSISKCFFEEEGYRVETVCTFAISEAALVQIVTKFPVTTSSV
jgi:hypothetical protein